MVSPKVCGRLNSSRPVGPPAVPRKHDDIGRKQQGEDDGVGHQIEPETERPGLVPLALPFALGRHRPCVGGDAHGAAPIACASGTSLPSARISARPTARSAIATIFYLLDRRCRHAPVRYRRCCCARSPPRQSRPRQAIASHQMYQTMAKPNRPASTPTAMPKALFFGMAMSLIGGGPLPGDALFLHVGERVAGRAPPG